MRQRAPFSQAPNNVRLTLTRFPCPPSSGLAGYPISVIIYIIEGARTSDSESSLHDIDARKHHHYRPLRQKLRTTYPEFQIHQLNFVIGIRGTINEQQWARNLETLGVPGRSRTKIIQRCMVASIEGMQLVLGTKWETET